MGEQLRIALFGGSFDPVHNGHLELAAAARKEFGLSTVIFVPAKQPPHKRQKRLAPVEDRLKMLALALRPHPYFGLSHFEVRRKTTTYTYQTVTYFRTLYPTAIVFFILGSDSLAELKTWKKLDVLSGLCTFIVGKRAGKRTPRPELPSVSALFLKESVAPVSSTEIRERIRAGKPVTGLVPPPVETYIRDHELYR